MSARMFKYRSVTVVEHWLFSGVTLALIVTGLPFAIMWLFDVSAIFPIFSIDKGTGAEFAAWHPIFGIVFVVLGLVHLAIHSRSSEYWFARSSSESRLFSRDFRALMHSLAYLLGFSNRREHSGEKFDGYQRANYVSLLFACGASAFTGVCILLGKIAGLELAYLSDIARISHLLFGTFLFLIVTYHICLKFRALDPVPFATMFLGREVPFWYAKQHFPSWVKDVHSSSEFARSAKGTPANSNARESSITRLIYSIYPDLSEDEVQEIAGIFAEYEAHEEGSGMREVEEVLGGSA